MRSGSESVGKVGYGSYNAENYRPQCPFVKPKWPSSKITVEVKYQDKSQTIQIPSCASLTLIKQLIPNGWVKEGDYLYVPRTGKYLLSESASDFVNHTSELIVSSKNHFYEDYGLQIAEDMSFIEYVNRLQPLMGSKSGCNKISLQTRHLLVNQTEISFNRTLRIQDDGKEYQLPSSLGLFPLLPSHVVQHKLPKSWYDDKEPKRSNIDINTGEYHEAVELLMPIHSKEAMFIAFSARNGSDVPSAIKCGMGGINALTGEPFIDFQLSESPQDYMVSPPQVWLDGIISKEGTVQQFVATTLGKEKSVAAQVKEQSAEEELQDTENTLLQLSCYAVRSYEFAVHLMNPDGTLNKTLSYQQLLKSPKQNNFPKNTTLQLGIEKLRDLTQADILTGGDTIQIIHPSEIYEIFIKIDDVSKYTNTRDYYTLEDVRIQATDDKNILSMLVHKEMTFHVVRNKLASYLGIKKPTYPRPYQDLALRLQMQILSMESHDCNPERIFRLSDVDERNSFILTNQNTRILYPQKRLNYYGVGAGDVLQFSSGQSAAAIVRDQCIRSLSQSLTCSTTESLTIPTASEAFDNTEPVIVIDCGSLYTKHGFSGEQLPRGTQLSAVGRPRHCCIMVGMGQVSGYLVTSSFAC